MKEGSCTQKHTRIIHGDRRHVLRSKTTAKKKSRWSRQRPVPRQGGRESGRGDMWRAGSPATSLSRLCERSGRRGDGSPLSPARTGRGRCGSRRSAPASAPGWSRTGPACTRCGTAPSGYAAPEPDPQRRDPKAVEAARVGGGGGSGSGLAASEWRWWRRCWRAPEWVRYRMGSAGSKGPSPSDSGIWRSRFTPWKLLDHSNRNRRESNLETREQACIRYYLKEISDLGGKKTLIRIIPIDRSKKLQ